MTSKYELLTPEEIAAATKRLPVSKVKRLAREGLVEHTRGSAGRILFTRAQFDALMAYLTAPATPAPKTTAPVEPEAPRWPAEVVSKPASDPFGGSRRSKAARRDRVRA